MILLQAKLHEAVCSRFIKTGYFTIRRNFGTDMTNEHTLMRNMKSCGGITSERGIIHSVLEKWIFGGPFLTQSCESLKNSFGVYVHNHPINILNIEILHDSTDINKVDAWLEKKNPSYPI